MYWYLLFGGVSDSNVCLALLFVCFFFGLQEMFEDFMFLKLAESNKLDGIRLTNMRNEVFFFNIVRQHKEQGD